MPIGMYPGRFDPVTNGHLDIIGRAAMLFDRLIVAPYDSQNASFMFSTDERVNLLRASVAELPNVEVLAYRGLTVNFAREQGVGVLVRGIRAVTDFNVEFDQALMNKKMAPEIESVYLMSNLEHLFVSASRIREVSALGYNVDNLVPAPVAEALRAKFGRR